MTKQEKIDLLHFCTDWQKTNNQKLSMRFIQTYCELSPSMIYKFKKRNILLKSIINFDTRNLTVKEIARKVSLPTKTIQNFLNKNKLKYIKYVRN